MTLLQQLFVVAGSRYVKGKDAVKSFTVLLLPVFLISICVSLSDAQWVQTDGPYRGDITCFASDSTTIFAGTNGGGVFRSSNNGASWTAVSTGLTNTKITALAVDSTNLIAGTFGNYHAGIFLSTDNGASWNEASSGLTNQNITALVVDDTSIFAGTANGLFLSTDNGASWSEVMKNTSIGALITDSTNVIAGTGNSIFKSTDGGKNWTEIDSGVKGNRINAIAKSGTTLFVGITIPQGGPVGSKIIPKGGVYLSENDGLRWTVADNGLPDTPVTSLVAKDGNIYAGTSSGVYISKNNGKSWTQMNSGLTDTSINTFVVKGTNLFAGTGSGVFLSTNNGSSWKAANAGIINQSISALAVLGSNLVAGDRGILLSTDSGKSWNTVDSGLPYVSSFARSGTDLFAAMRFSPGILRSTNNGKSWSLLDTSSTSDYFTCLAASGTNIFAGDGQTGKGVFLSTDNGANWTSINTGLTNKWVYSLAVLPSGNGGTDIYAGTQNGGFFRSTNNGKSWSLISTDLSNEIVFSLVTMGTKLFAGTDNGVYLSTNGGASWTSLGPKYAYVTSLAVSGTNLFAGASYTAYSDGGVFLTTDDGAKWTSVDSGLINTDISALAVNGTSLFAGTYGSGTWVRPLSEMITSVTPQPNNIPDGFSLSQNYPNPFNPSTTISYRLPKDTHVVLEVFDVLGREIQTLVNERQRAGKYSVTFNANNLPSGIYFYRLDAGRFHETKKLLFIK